ncbi:zinc finger MYM-type protein 1-like [Limulus polyphemus]|uniref:Zinc finger MYM-type protein 1-like n=1 Tax=Limulus polyphemus TaxID=6850 RepID=A0ABM1BMI3_LIMPO|nr:zinc finger MYM-type protein 1-like [Limulus polyphemus]
MDVDVSAPIQSEDCQPGSSTSDNSILPSDDILQSAPTLWKVDRHFQEEIVKKLIEQNIYKQDFSRSEREHNGHKRYLTKSLFERTMLNGEKVNREWLVYSLSTGCVYCAPCKVFCQKNEDKAFINGFSNWKNPHSRVRKHENSSKYKNCIRIWHDRASDEHRIDQDLVRELEEEKKYWQSVLRRIVEVIKFLRARGLAFRGNDEQFESSKNSNCLGILELLAKFDPFLAQHIQKYAGAGKGSPSYLSKIICEELIKSMLKQLLMEIVSEIKQAEYFSISVDSTSDISYVDHLTFIIRYVVSHGKPIERFINFVEVHSHKAENLANVVKDVITEDLGLDISNLRGQSYENSSNMAGAYSGLQDRIKELNTVAHFLPCAAH